MEFMSAIRIRGYPGGGPGLGTCSLADCARPPRRLTAAPTALLFSGPAFDQYSYIRHALCALLILDCAIKVSHLLPLFGADS
jgi:hypothetical protein